MNSNSPTASQPILNLPRVIAISAALLLAVHALRQLLSVDQDNLVLLHFAFFPMAYSFDDGMAGLSLLDGVKVWSPFTYGFLHINWTHVIINTLWLVVFGTPVAIRFGAMRFIVFCLAAAPFGALAHYLSYGADGPPVIGASAIVSGLTAAALRFAFSSGGGLKPGSSDPARFRQPAPGLIDNLKDRQVLGFLIVWLVVNLVFGLGSAVMGGDMQVAWQAHLGGFLAGLVLFQCLDPIDRKHKIRL